MSWTKYDCKAFDEGCYLAGDRQETFDSQTANYAILHSSNPSGPMTWRLIWVWLIKDRAVPLEDTRREEGAPGVAEEGIRGLFYVRVYWSAIARCPVSSFEV